MSFVEAVIATGVALLVPVLFAALGELVAERAGVINIGLEGMMVAGGFAGFWTMYKLKDPYLAAAIAAGAGMVVAAVMAAVSVYGRANQIVTGFALFIMAPGIIDFIYNQQTEGLAIVPSTSRMEVIEIPGLNQIPVIGEALFEQNAYYYGLAVLAVLVFLVMSRTRFGLEAAAAGHDPEAAKAKGVHVLRVRAIATLAAGAMAGLGGAALTVGALGSYSPGVMDGRGFLAIAIVILGRWKVGWTVAAAAVLGFTDALRLRISEDVDIPVQLLGLLPWLVVLVLLVWGARGSGRSVAFMPRALGRTAE
jgi:general nucleoside transport system permease protein